MSFIATDRDRLEAEKRLRRMMPSFASADRHSLKRIVEPFKAHIGRKNEPIPLPSAGHIETAVPKRERPTGELAQLMAELQSLERQVWTLENRAKFPPTFDPPTVENRVVQIDEFPRIRGSGHNRIYPYGNKGVEIFGEYAGPFSGRTVPAYASPSGGTMLASPDVEIRGGRIYVGIHAYSDFPTTTYRPTTVHPNGAYIYLHLQVATGGDWDTIGAKQSPFLADAAGWPTQTEEAIYIVLGILHAGADSAGVYQYTTWEQRWVGDIYLCAYEQCQGSTGETKWISSLGIKYLVDTCQSLACE